MLIKKRILRISILTMFLGLLSVSYGFFTYFSVGNSNKLISGEIYLKYENGSDELSLSNVFPETPEEARARTDNTINFTISGKNTTTNKDIYYEIKLLHAKDKTGKNRFKDSHIKFDLIETTNGISKTVLDAVSYETFDDTSIYVNLVDANTLEDIMRTYQLRMWLSDDILISDSNEGADYTTSKFRDSYSNVKVVVSGDFIYKEYFYAINYELNGGIQASDAVVSYTFESETFDLPLPSKDGYEFKGWYDNPELTGQVHTKIEKGTKGNKMYYAKWEEYKVYTNVNIYNVVSDNASLDNVSSLFVSNSQGIDFADSAGINNGYGVYMESSTKNNSYPVYYYRGQVKNNNVLFANYCWKMVRTTETGGTKLIFNGLPIAGNCNNTGANAQLSSKIKFNSLGPLEAVGYSYGNTHKLTYKYLSSITNGMVFGNDVTYVDGHYEFINNDEDDIYIADNNITTDAKNILKTHHYTCFETADKKCSTMYFIYMIRGTTFYYVTLHTGEKIEDALYNGLTNSTNTTSSTIKTYIDNWYAANMTNYTSYLEDTIWCNDRSIASAEGWTKDGAIIDDSIYKINFSGYNRLSTNKDPSLICTNPSDRFTVSTNNGNGALTYPTALLTMDETALAGYVWYQASDNNYLNNGKVWWTMTPTLLSVGNVYLGVVYSIMDNVHAAYISNDAGGVRPAISLKYGIKVSGGNGTHYNPFTIESIQ